MRSFLLSFVLFFSVSASANFSLSPETIDFQNVMIGFYEKATVIVTNESESDLVFSFREACEEDFSYIDASCRRVLKPGRSCFVDLYFQPLNEGFKSCSVYINDDQDFQALIYLSGTGVVQP